MERCQCNLARLDKKRYLQLPQLRKILARRLEMSTDPKPPNCDARIMFQLGEYKLLSNVDGVSSVRGFELKMPDDPLGTRTGDDLGVAVRALLQSCSVLVDISEYTRSLGLAALTIRYLGQIIDARDGMEE